MARLIFSSPFIDDLAALDSAVERELWSKLKLVEQVPGVGSALVGAMLQQAFGDTCLKINVHGFEVIYERRTIDDEEVVYVLGIVHERRVR